MKKIKSVIISVILLLLVCTGVGVNLIYMKNTAGELIDDTAKLPDNEVEFLSSLSRVESIGEKWHNHRGVIVYFMDLREIDEADRAFTQLYNNVKSEDFESYLVSRDEFIHALTRLLEINEISLENIL